MEYIGIKLDGVEGLERDVDWRIIRSISISNFKFIMGYERKKKVTYIYLLILHTWICMCASKYVNGNI